MKTFIPIAALVFFFLTLFSIGLSNSNLVFIFGLCTLILFILSTPKYKNQRINNARDITSKLQSLEAMLEKELISFEEFKSAKDKIFMEEND